MPMWTIVCILTVLMLQSTRKHSIAFAAVQPTVALVSAVSDNTEAALSKVVLAYICKSKSACARTAIQKLHEHCRPTQQTPSTHS